MQASLSWSFTAGQDLKTVVEFWVSCLQEKLSARSPSTPLCLLHLMEIKLISFAPPFMDNELKEQVQHISLEFLPSQPK